MAMTNKIDVVIGGKVLTIRSEESAEHVQRIAMYVDQKIQMLKEKNLTAVVDERLRAVLIALNLADDYFKVKDLYTAQEITFQKVAKETVKLEKENATLKNQMKKLQAKLDKVTGEFEEFLHNFDNQEEKSVGNGKKVKALPQTDARKAAN